MLRILNQNKNKMKKTIAWVEIPALDMERAVRFYNGLLDLDLEILDFGPEKMAFFQNDRGAISLAPEFNPSENGVLVSLDVEDRLDESLVFVEANGGRILKGRTKIEAEGRDYFAPFTDCEGNRIGLYGK